MINKNALILSVILVLSSNTVTYAQDNRNYEISMEGAIELSLQHHQQLRVSKAEIELRKKQKEVTQLQQLPTITFNANAYYLGDVLLLNPDLSKAGSADLPNFGNTFAVQASQILYKGGAIRKTIELADLQTQLSELDMVQDQQSVKFLVISNYLDILKLLNQKKVLHQNKLLVEQRLSNVTKLYGQGMVNRNELIRAELDIKTLEQNILVLTNNHTILSNRLSYALGLQNDILIIPLQTANPFTIKTLPEYISLAQERHPQLLAAKQNIGIAQKNIDITKTELLPTLSFVGGYNMQRPLTSSTPPMDLYNNSWQAGVALSYNIDNLFKTKKRVEACELQKNIVEENFVLSQQNIEMEVSAAYVRYNESVKQAGLMRESQRLANENYRIIEAKYLNQLAITAEMTDASSAKLNAELQYANAEINVVFQYYNLLKSTGTL